MNYSVKIEQQRRRFYSRFRSIIKRALNVYLAELEKDIKQATTTQQIIAAADKNLNKEVIEKAMSLGYRETMPFFAKQAVKQLNTKKAQTVQMDEWDFYIKHTIVPKLAKRISWITNTTKDVFQDTCKRLCAEGLAEGLGVPEIAKGIMKDLEITERYRAERIARTEVVSASNAGSLAGAESTGLELDKQWISFIDDKTRESHIELDNKTVAMDDTFENGLEYPGDISVDKPEEVINCRCTIGYVVKDNNFAFGREIND